MAQDVGKAAYPAMDVAIRNMKGEYHAAARRYFRLIAKGQEYQAKVMQGYEYTPDQVGAWLNRADQKKLEAAAKRVKQLEGSIEQAYRKAGIRPSEWKISLKPDEMPRRMPAQDYPARQSPQVPRQVRKSPPARVEKAPKEPTGKMKARPTVADVAEPSKAGKLGKVAKGAGKALGFLGNVGMMYDMAGVGKEASDALGSRTKAALADKRLGQQMTMDERRFGGARRSMGPVVQSAMDGEEARIPGREWWEKGGRDIWAQEAQRRMERSGSTTGMEQIQAGMSQIDAALRDSPWMTATDARQMARESMEWQDQQNAASYRRKPAGGKARGLRTGPVPGSKKN